MSESQVLEISTLGGLSIHLAGEPVTGFTSRKVEALLVYLACTGRAHSRDVLADLLWDDLSQSRAMGNLRVVLYSLRQQLEPYVEVTRESVGLNPESPLWVDVGELDETFADVREAGGLSSPSAADQLAKAISLYKGDFLAGFYVRDCERFEEWMRLEQQRLRGLVAKGLHDLLEYHLQRGAYEAGLAHARRLLELDPWMEAAHRGVMTCLARSEGRSAALAQYEACRQVLEEELGVEPEPETTALYKRILAGEIAALAPAAAPPRHNLPVQLTPFVGRTGELGELDKLLSDPDVRLVTVLGPGGMGKTRLSLEAAGAQLDGFAHGVFFVSLAPLGSAEGIVPAVAEAVGFTFYEEGEPRQQLLDYLRGKKLLLVMDNYEHLLEGVDLVSDVLQTAPAVRILATSRARLNVRGEQVCHLAGMDFPDWETPVDAEAYSAVELFLHSARRVRSDFQLRGDDLTYLTRICRLAGGMPLGILLAAGWVDSLTPAEIAAEIAHSLDFLETETRDVPKRQSSIRAVFDHSWRLLAEREKQVLQGLSVFRGGFSREAAGAVTGATMRELRALVNRSLLGHTPIGRYDLHELLRQYAEEKLDQVPAAAETTRDQHCAYYVAALRQWGTELKGARQQTALAEIETDIENATAAWNRAVEQGQAAPLDQALEGLCLFYSWRGRFQEGMAVCRAAANGLRAAVQSDRRRVLARVLVSESSFCRALGHTDLANKHLENCLGLLETTDLDTRAERASVLVQMGGLAFDAGDNTEARRLIDESLNLYQALGDRWGEAAALGALGYVAWSVSAYDEAKQWAEKSLALRQSIGDKRGIANSLDLMGLIVAYSGQMEESVRLRRDIVDIRMELDDRPGAANALYGLATGLIWSGEFAAAQALLEESLESYADLGSRGGVAQNDAFLGWIDAMNGLYEQARIRFENGLLVFREMGQRRGLAIALLFRGMSTLAEGDYAASKRLLTEAVDFFEEIGQRGEWALAIASLGYAARAEGHTAQAQSYLYRALETLAEHHSTTGLITMPIPATALLLADAGKKELAVEIYALVKRYPFVANSRWFEDVAGKHIAAVAATLPSEVVAAAQERGRARDLWATAAELVVELGNMIAPPPGVSNP